MDTPLQSTSESTETMAEAQRSIVDNFQFLDDWADRYQYIIELGRRLPPFPEAAQTDANRMYGCQSGVWFLADYRDRRLFFEATSDSAIVAGLIALLLKVYSGRTPGEILATSPSFIEEIGLAEHLSPHRKNGLALMVERIRTFAANVSGDLAGGDA